MFVKGNLTATAATDLPAGRRVKIKTGTVTYPPEVELAGADAKGFGTVIDKSFAGELVAIRPFASCGLHEACTAGAYAVGAPLYAAADGKVDDAGTVLVGTAFSPSTGVDEIREVIFD